MARPKKETSVISSNSKPKNNSLLEKIMKNSNSDMMAIIDESSFFNDIEMVPTDIPVLNIAFSGSVDGGFTGGLTTIAGPSRHFKSSIGLACMAGYQKKYDDGIGIFMDSEGGITGDYFRSFGINTKSIVHDPVTDVEELKHKMVPQLDGLVRGDHAMFFIDSIGNLSSKREYDNALEGNTAVDMTRAKELKSFTRLINGKLKIKKIPCVAINHTYQTLEMFSKMVMGGGTGMMLASDTVLFVGRNQDKNTTTKEVEGWNFNIVVEKSRFVKEKSKVSFSVKYDGGIQKYSGLAEIGVDLGVVEETKIGKSIAYQFKDMVLVEEECNVSEEFWNKVFTESDFKRKVEERFRLIKPDYSNKEVEVEE